MSPATEPITLVLIRHGETDHTVLGALAGRGSDLDLNDRGRATARATAQTLAHRAALEGWWHHTGAPDAVIHSGMKRTASTCTIISEQASPSPTPASQASPMQASPNGSWPVPIADPAWAEIDFGTWEGLTFAQVSDQDPDAATAWLGSVDYAPERGETVRDFGNRIAQALGALIPEFSGKTVVLVAHGGTISSLIAQAIGLNLADAWNLQLAPGSISALRIWQTGAPDSGNLRDWTAARLLCLNVR